VLGPKPFTALPGFRISWLRLVKLGFEPNEELLARRNVLSVQVADMAVHLAGRTKVQETSDWL
jgi:hypothetical protein